MAKRVLVADDSRLILRLAAMNLEKAGFEVITAADGLEALERARVESPDLIILDIMMPEMDGFEVCRLLKADVATSSIPVIFLTARGEEEDRHQGMDFGAVDFVTKPFSPRKLIEKVNQYLT